MDLSNKLDPGPGMSVDPINASPQRLVFGCFEVDLRSGELTKQGKRIPLQGQPFRLLAMLLERPGELITREEVRQKLWPNTIVDFDHGLNKAISKIRDALGDSAEKPRFVETVARRGYRFLADVKEVPDQASQSTTQELRSAVPEQQSATQAQPSAAEETQSAALERQSAMPEQPSATLEQQAATAGSPPAAQERQSARPAQPSATPRQASATPESTSATPNQLSTTLEQQSATSGQPTATNYTAGSDVSISHRVSFRRSLAQRSVALWIIFGAAMVLLLSTAWVLTHRQRSAPNIHSVAVLPLSNLSGDASQEYFADGMTDELITRLGQISALRVISRTSSMTYKNTRKPLANIARDLDVQAVVEGSVLHVGDRVRITAQLIRVPEDEHMWAHSYEGSLRDTLALQGEVSQAIATQIQATVSQRERVALMKAGTVSSEAHEAYLKGRYFWNKRDAAGLKKAIEYFQRAIAVDPGYAEAYSGLADAYALAGGWEYGVLTPQEAAPRAKEAATKAVLLDPTLSEAHTSLAFALDLSTWDWSGAEKEFRRALELNPGYATAHHWYGYHLMMVGRDDEGIAELKKAERLDPLSLIISAGVADVLYLAHRFDEATHQLQKTLEMDPNFAMAHYQMGQVLVQQHRLDSAITEFQRAIQLSGHSPAFDANLANAYSGSERAADAQRIAKDLEQLPEQNGSVDANIALIYVGLGEADHAMYWLDKAYQARFEPVMLVRPQFDPLRGDPRFKDLMSRVGLGK